MTSDIIIRKANASDAARIAELSGTLGYPASAEVMHERLDRVLKLETHVVFVAIAKGEIVGWTHGAEQEILEIGCVCEIWGLVVDENHRGHGVGHLLIQAIEQWALARGLNEISVRSNVVRPESHHFYERIGYERFKTQHAYRKEL
jgi:GNAT superfamily N-acetyltransferase